MRMFLSTVPLVVAFAVFFGANAAQAHTKLEKAEPAEGTTVSAPLKQVKIRFSGKLDPKMSKIALIGPAGPVKTGAAKVEAERSLVASIDADLPSGKYTVAWQTAGGDGHVQKGEYSFSVAKAGQ